MTLLKIMKSLDLLFFIQIKSYIFDVRRHPQYPHPTQLQHLQYIHCVLEYIKVSEQMLVSLRSYSAAYNSYFLLVSQAAHGTYNNYF